MQQQNHGEYFYYAPIITCYLSNCKKICDQTYYFFKRRSQTPFFSITMEKSQLHNLFWNSLAHQQATTRPKPMTMPKYTSTKPLQQGQNNLNNIPPRVSWRAQRPSCRVGRREYAADLGQKQSGIFSARILDQALV